jgi:hypothetical protein
VKSAHLRAFVATQVWHDYPSLGVGDAARTSKLFCDTLDWQIKATTRPRATGKLDRLDEALLFAQSIDATSYERRLREELTLAQIDHHAEAVDELDVKGILAFAERILPRASDLRVQATLDYKQRLQQLFFPEGVAFDGNRFNRTAVTAPLFKYLAPSESADEKVVTQTAIEPAESISLPKSGRRTKRRRVIARTLQQCCAL